MLARLIREVKAGRALIETQQAQIESLQALIADEQKNSASLTVSYDSAKRQINLLQLAIASKDEAIAAKNETIAVLTHQRDEERTKRKKANKRAMLATLGAAALIVLKFLK